jgi:uncharacterized protein
MSYPPIQPKLLVDGYNIIGAWPKLDKLRDRHGLEVSRQKLIEALINYSACEGLNTHLVFDAQYQNKPVVAETITHELSVCYTDFGQTADSYIEKFCADFRYHVSRSITRLIVATSDRTQKLVVTGYGAEWISAQRLIGELETNFKRYQSQQKHRKQANRAFLFDTLDPKTKQKLEDLRKKGSWS